MVNKDANTTNSLTKKLLFLILKSYRTEIYISKKKYSWFQYRRFPNAGTIGDNFILTYT